MNFMSWFKNYLRTKREIKERHKKFEEDVKQMRGNSNLPRPLVLAATIYAMEDFEALVKSGQEIKDEDYLKILEHHLNYYKENRQQNYYIQRPPEFKL